MFSDTYCRLSEYVVEMRGGKRHWDPGGLRSRGKKGTEEEKADSARGTFLWLHNLVKALSCPKCCSFQWIKLSWEIVFFLPSSLPHWLPLCCILHSSKERWANSSDLWTMPGSFSAPTLGIIQFSVNHRETFSPMCRNHRTHILLYSIIL